MYDCNKSIQNQNKLVKYTAGGNVKYMPHRRIAVILKGENV
jgi:hypothetical protein